MSKKYDKEMELAEKYPKILKNLGGNPMETCMSWAHGGISVGDGWYPLLDKLMGFLQFHTDKNGYPQVIADQIKEKFGTLCFYYHCEPNTDYEYPEHQENRNDDFMDGAISFAERMSSTICEKCGKPGNTRGKGWIYTSCDKCDELRK